MNGSVEQFFIEKFKRLQDKIVAAVTDGMRSGGEPDAMAAVDSVGRDDTIYKIDKLGEEQILDFFERRIRPEVSCVLVAEGIADGCAAFTHSGRAEDAEFLVIMDPVDGSRGLMHGKRSAWSLAGVSNNHDKATLRNIRAAVMTEIPTPKQALHDQLWAVRGEGAHGVRRDLDGGRFSELRLTPSSAETLEHGFATFCRFFAGVKDIIAEIEEEFVRSVSGFTWPFYYFEDQYVCSGGQLYELIMGHDRMVCDLRALLAHKMRERGDPAPLCSHPYDMCTELIAREAGVIVTGTDGKALAAPLDTTSNVGWIGWANQSLRNRYEHALREVLIRRRLLTP